MALGPRGRALAMETLFFPDEVVSQDDLDGLPKEDMAASERES
jgi:non-homologous end joining protein Ku